MPLALRARALWKSYAAGVAGCSARVWVLRGANLDVEEGECAASAEHRDAGTTTLLHCLAGLRRTDGGTIQCTAEPQLVARATESERPARLLLIDDECCGTSDQPPILNSEGAGVRRATIIATHELARVRHLADRVLLLRDGRLTPLHRASGIRRVAESAIHLPMAMSKQPDTSSVTPTRRGMSIRSPSN